VVRYYGGTKLGVGGLISAYKTAAEQAVANGEIIERHEESDLIIRFEAQHTGDAMMLINQSKANIINHSVDEKGHFVHIRMRKSFSLQLISSLEKTGKFEHDFI
jgi:putative IMPACT (imprinted ancient) family translation regulator